MSESTQAPRCVQSVSLVLGTAAQCRCAETYHSRQSSTERVRRPAAYNAWPGPSKLHEDACCISIANLPTRPINSSLASAASQCYYSDCGLHYEAMLDWLHSCLRFGFRIDPPWHEMR